MYLSNTHILTYIFDPQVCVYDVFIVRFVAECCHCCHLIHKLKLGVFMCFVCWKVIRRVCLCVCENWNSLVYRFVKISMHGYRIYSSIYIYSIKCKCNSNDKMWILGIMVRSQFLYIITTVSIMELLKWIFCFVLFKKVWIQVHFIGSFIFIMMIFFIYSSGYEFSLVVKPSELKQCACFLMRAFFSCFGIYVSLQFQVNPFDRKL